MKRVGVLAVLLMVSTGVEADPSASESYDLQERCKASVQLEFSRDGNFEIEHKTTTGDLTSAHYTAHYNKSLNKCYAVVSWTLCPGGDRSFPTHGGELRDVSEHQIIASWIEALRKFQGKVGDVVLPTRYQWNKAVYRYMTD